MFSLLLFCSILVGTCYARTENEIRAWFVELGIECSKDFQITPEELQALKNHNKPDNKNINCFLACVYKKANWLDDKGMFKVEDMHAMIDKEQIENKERLKKSHELFDICGKVNDESVSDGQKGCDRAEHMFKCLTENAKKMGLLLQ